MSLASVLAWKFDNAPGIRTREAKGKMEIFNWPAALGPKPTKAQIGQWTTEFNARPPAPHRLEAQAQAIEGAGDLAALKMLVAQALRAL